MYLRLKADLFVVWLIAIIEALLLTRLVFKLFAARPDHPVVHSIFAITMPLVSPLAMLDTSQPQFGAVLEFSTLVLVIAVPCVWFAIRYSQRFVGARRAHT